MKGGIEGNPPPPGSFWIARPVGCEEIRSESWTRTEFERRCASGKRCGERDFRQSHWRQEDPGRGRRGESRRQGAERRGRREGCSQGRGKALNGRGSAHRRAPHLALQERPDCRHRLQRREFIRGRKLRAVACTFTMHRKPSGSPAVARNWCHVQAGIVTRSNCFTASHFVANHALAMPAQDHHRMGMLVPLQRRVAAGIHLEIAQFAGQRVVVEQDLAGDVLERRAAPSCL